VRAASLIASCAAGHRGIAGADLAVVEPQVRAAYPDVGHAVEKLV